MHYSIEDYCLFNRNMSFSLSEFYYSGQHYDFFSRKADLLRLL